MGRSSCEGLVRGEAPPARTEMKTLGVFVWLAASNEVVG